MKKLIKQIQDTLKESRFEHTLGVMYTAASLAMRYEENIEKAMMAGLLHDCAKGMTGSDLIAFCEEKELPISEAEYTNPELLHAKAGAYLAQHKYGIEDESILNAITNHTTGQPNMSLLEKIIYIADYIEPHRNQAPNLDTLRCLAFENIDVCLRKILEATLTYLRNENKTIDSKTEETYKYYNKKG